MMGKIIGFKGGKSARGGSSRTPIESPDTLRSRAYARLIDLVCEGEIEGLATGDLRSVYFDKTPVMNDDGSLNFTGVTIVTREGTQSQSFIDGFPSVESERAVGVQVLNGLPVVRTISSDAYDTARVTLSTPQLSTTNITNGDISGASIDFRIEVQPNGGSFQTVYEDSIRGKTSTKYQRSYTFKLPGSAPWNVRVTRITPDSTSQYTQNNLFFDSLAEITSGKFKYPNCALVATLIDSQQFNQIPVRGYDMKMLRIQVPVNYNPITREYTGTWNGTFKIAWSDNPAWVFYDMITNDRYGLGQFIAASQIDKWSLYQIGRYCDELVPDGFGGFEPRFTCNLYLQEQEEAFKVINDLASIFRGMVYWASGQITAIQDAPADPVALYTNANVVDGDFTYSGSSLKTRHTVALVSWNDPDDFYALKPEYVEDADGISRYGVIQTNIVALGCTSRGQAHRLGKWLLYSEINEGETVSFKAGLDGAVARPGQIISVSDSNRAGVRRGGRIISATTNSVTIDAAFPPEVGVTYTLSVMLPDGTVATSPVASISGAVINLSQNLPALPQANAIWAVSASNLSPQKFRVVSVIDAGDNTFEITGVKHNGDKYDFVERNLVLTENPISVLNDPPAAPSGLVVSEFLYQTVGAIQNAVSIAWNQVERADYYILTYRIDDGNPITISNIPTQSYELRDAPTGFYDVQVVAVSVAGKRSAPASVQKDILGKLSPPADVTGFSIAGISNGVAQFVWDQAADLDVIVGGYVRIRHTPDTVAPSWTSAVDIGPALPGNATTASLPHIDGTYLAKFVDSSNNSSVNAVAVSTKSASLLTMNVIETIDESSFTGTRSNTYVTDLGAGPGLSLAGSGLISEISLISEVESFASLGGIAASGQYDFANTFDLGQVFTSRVTASITAAGFDTADLISLRGLVSTWSLVGGNYVDDVNATLYVRTTDDDPTGTPVWSSWRPFFVGQYTARAFQFRLLLTSGEPTHNISVTQLIVTVDMPDRVESQRNLTSGTGAYSVTFPTAFKATPAIGITANNMATGDYYTITAQSETGFEIQFRNAAGTGISRNFDYMAKGY